MSLTKALLSSVVFVCDSVLSIGGALHPSVALAKIGGKKSFGGGTGGMGGMMPGAPKGLKSAGQGTARGSRGTGGRGGKGGSPMMSGKGGSKPAAGSNQIVGGK